MKRALRKLFKMQPQHIETPAEREAREIREFWASLPASEQKRLLLCFAEGMHKLMEQKAAAA